MRTGAEEWRPIPGWEGLYEASSLGKIRSLPREIPNLLTGGTSTRGGKVLKHFVNKDGHHRVTISSCKMGEWNTYVHHLIALAFLGPRPSRMHALHIDDNHEDNSRENLYYGTPKDNGSDSVKNGRSCRGERLHSAIITEDQVRSIHSLKGKMKGIEIARRFGVTASLVSHINNGWAWYHVTGERNARSA